MNKYLYLFLFVFVNAWTVSIHDGESFTKHPFINGSANHTLHHLYFHYNYGQYFTLWDRMGGTYRQPTDRQYNRSLKRSIANRKQEAIEVDTLVREVGNADTKNNYLLSSAIAMKMNESKEE